MRSEPSPEPLIFGKRLSLPARVKSLPAVRIAAVWEAIMVAGASLRQNKLRTALTLIGIVVGVTAVISVVTIIKGLDQTVANTFNSQGSTVFTISKRPRVITSREDFIKYNKRKDLTEEDADAIIRLCTLCWRIGIVANDAVNTKHGNQKNENVQMRAISPISTFDIDGVSLDAGRYWSDAEGEDAHEVAVVGADIVTNSFPGLSADQVVGQQIWAGGRPYTILGVLQPLGKILGASRDNIIYVPFATYKKNFGVNIKRGAFSVASIVVLIQTQSAQQLEATEDQVRAVMRNRRGKTFSDEDDGFALETQDVFLNLYSAATSNIYLVTIGVAAISLVVGGIVVMNIMLVSVTERTKEIGIRKAVGATRLNILSQFLIEAVVLTAFGGVIGLALGEVASLLTNKYSPLPAFVPLWAIVVGIGISTAVGIVFGLWPAWKAARLDPIEALRWE